MKIEYYPFDTKFRLSDLDVHYTSKPQDWIDEIYQLPTLNGILEAAQVRHDRYSIDRGLLTRELQSQYAVLPDNPEVNKNLIKLESNTTFAIITAHQPVLMGGPLYTIYKILDTIALCKKLNDSEGPFQFVPIFVMGSEDHDKEEVNHFYHYGKKIKWNTDQTGAIGRYSCAGLEEVLHKIKEMNSSSQRAGDFIEDCFKMIDTSEHYRGFYQKMLHYIFGDYGLVVVDMDDAGFKRAFKPIFHKELQENFTKREVKPIQDIKSTKGYKPATYLRDINFFLLDNNGRHKLELDGAKKISVGDNSITLSIEELNNIINNNPESLSPNVNLRPLYQEFILPGVAYIGGGGEIAYWLERKNQFKAVDVFFPVLIRRDSVWWVDSVTGKKMRKLDIRFKDLQNNETEFIKDFVVNNASQNLDLSAIKDKISAVYDEMNKLATSRDATLSGLVEAEKVKALKSVELIQAKIWKTEKQSQEQALNTIHSIYEKLFPNGDSLQERKENFLSYYFKYGSTYFDSLLEVLDPLRKELKVILEEEGL
jgi:bacillithiol synthase